PIEERVVGAPGAAHAHGEVEVHLVSELALELAARGDADGLDHAPALADHDSLLRRGLDPDQRADHREPVARLVDVVEDDLYGVRELLEGPAQDGLADELGEQNTQRLIGARALLEEERSWRHERLEVLGERVNTIEIGRASCRERV